MLGLIRRARASFVDTSGMLFVDCAECAKSRFGGKLTMCQMKNKALQSRLRGCFCGTLKPDLFIRNFN